MADQSTPPAESKERPVKIICQNCSVPFESIDATPEGHVASSSPLSGSMEERPMQGVSTEDRESLPSASNEPQTSPTRGGADDGIPSQAQYVYGKICDSSLSLTKRPLKQIITYFGFAIYATIGVTVHLLRIDTSCPPLFTITIPFSAHLAWLTTTASFCCLLWLSILLDYTKTIPDFGAEVASVLAKRKSRLFFIVGISAIALLVLNTNLILTECWIGYLLELMELMPVYETSDFASTLVWVSRWIILIVILIFVGVIDYGLQIPVIAFGVSIQHETAEDAGSKAPLAEPNTEKPRSVSIVNLYADPQSKNAPATKSSSSSFPLAGPTTEDCTNAGSLGYSIQLALSVWLLILHYTWLEVEIAPDTHIFLRWLCMAPRWWATGFSLIIFFSTASLKGDLRTRGPKTEDLLSRASMKRTQLLTQARSFISAVILSVDLVWLFAVLIRKVHSIESYQPEKLEKIALYIFFISMCPLFASIPWIFFEDYKSTVSESNRRLDRLDKGLKETANRQDQGDPVVPDSCSSPSQVGDLRKQVRDAVLSKKRDGGPASMGTEEPGEDDWQEVEQGSKDEHSSNISSAFAPGVATEILFSDTNKAEIECDGSNCKWKRVHDELHSIVRTRLADQQARFEDSEDRVKAMEAEINERLRRTESRLWWRR